MESRRAAVTTELFYSYMPKARSSGPNPNRPPPKPFIIERIGDCESERVYREIADVCIDVFFKEQLNARPEDRVPPWKEAQISYLKTLQTGDLRRRRDRYPQSNEMFLAYAAEPALNEYYPNRPLIMDNAEIYNLPSYVADQPFVRGELLGFVEITQRPYGLGQGRGVSSDPVRPILTNLAVSRSARTLGIGGKLLDRCESHVARNWRMGEIVLEVEDYNTQALNFYTKRGYEVLYADPASRRFDVSGLVLRKVRCTRQVLRKVLTWQRAQQAGEEVNARNFNFFSQFVPRGGNYYK